MSGFGDGFISMLEGNRPRPASPQAQGLVEGKILDVNIYTATFSLLTNDQLSYGPAPFGRTSTPPQPGDKCLVGFVGTGIDRPWIIAWTPN